ncbi:hypothetical protein [Streptomyces sp. NPDC003077]|uniref:hypothetical protein n=1 Tax=Streptomyces sp. NPDC003077 TaxID=3154443 RepID=UPI0033B29FAE
MDPVVVVYVLAASIIAGATRLVYVWLRGRTQVRLAQLREQELSNRVRALPPGSRMTQKREGDVLIEVGSSSKGWL